MPFLAAALPVLGAAGGAVANAFAPSGSEQMGKVDLTAPNTSPYLVGGQTPEQAAALQSQTDLANLENAIRRPGNVTSPVSFEEGWRLATPEMRARYTEAMRKNQLAGQAAAQAPTMATRQMQEMQALARGYQTESPAEALYRKAAMGEGPSAAQAMLNQNLGLSNQQAMALAAGARGGGGNLALAQRAAVQQQGQNAMQAANQAAMLRAQEQQAGMQGFSQAEQARRQAAMQGLYQAGQFGIGAGHLGMQGAQMQQRAQELELERARAAGAADAAKAQRILGSAGRGLSMAGQAFAPATGGGYDANLGF